MSMLSYSYVARDHRGQLNRGAAMAASPQELRGLLHTQNLQLVSWSESLKSVRGSTIGWPKLSWPFLRRPSWSSIEVALRQLAMMLRSGLDLRSSLLAVANQTSSRRLRRSLQRVVHDVEHGQAFAGALQVSQAFPDIVVQLAAVGEASGTLSEVLEKAANHLERRRSSINTVRVALAYPGVVAIATVLVASYLIVSVIPQLQKFLTAMGRKLPAMTQSLVDLSLWFQINGQALLVAIVAVGVGVFAAMRWQPARIVIDRWLLRMPIVGRILQVAGTGTLASSLAVMTRSGVQLVESLSISAGLQGNRHLAGCVDQAAHSVRRGEPWQPPSTRSQDSRLCCRVCLISLAARGNSKRPWMMFPSGAIANCRHA